MQEINTETYLKKKKVKRAYGRERYKNMTEDEKVGWKNIKKLPSDKKYIFQFFCVV